MDRFIEVAIRTGILLVAAGMVLPFVRSGVVQQDVREAAAEIDGLAAALRSMTSDTAVGPTRGPRGRPATLHRLIGPGTIAPGSYFQTDRHQGWLEDHLASNQPDPKTQYDGWDGPYFEPRPDPWGSAYVVVLHPALSEEGGDCLIICAGPNRVMDADYSAGFGAMAVGDDLVQRVSLRCTTRP